MGYYSDFHVDGTDIVGIQQVLDRYTDPYTWDDYNHAPYLHAKWYDWLKDLQNLARDYPENYVVILRYGEEGGDISRAVVTHGSVVEQFPQMVWPSISLK